MFESVLNVQYVESSEPLLNVELVESSLSHSWMSTKTHPLWVCLSSLSLSIMWVLECDIAECVSCAIISIHIYLLHPHLSSAIMNANECHQLRYATMSNLCNHAWESLSCVCLRVMFENVYHRMCIIECVWWNVYHLRRCRLVYVSKSESYLSCAPLPRAHSPHDMLPHMIDIFKKSKV